MWCRAARIQNLGWPRLLCWQAVVFEPVYLTRCSHRYRTPAVAAHSHSPSACTFHFSETAVAKDRAFVYFLSVKVHFLKPTAAQPHCVCWLCCMCVLQLHIVGRLTLCSPLVTICTSNIHKIYVLPNTIFICFVWISGQTAIISLYNINWPVFVTETGCVYCAVRTEYLNVIQV